MKKQILMSVVSVFISFLITGVSAADTPVAEKLDLKLRLKPGQEYGTRIITEDKISQTIGGKQLNISHMKATAVGFEVKEVDANGIALVKVTYRTLQEKTVSPEGGMEYDSMKPDTAANDPLARMYTAMMGESFVMKVTPEGKVVELKGIDKMLLGMAEKIMAAEDEFIKERMKERAKEAIERTNKRYGSRKKRKEALKEMIKKIPMLGEDQIKNMLSGMIMVFPDRPVGIGDSWTDKMILASQSLPIEIDGTYTVKGSKKGVVIVDISSKRDLDDEGVLIGKVRMKIAGSYQGTSEIDEASGWMIRSKANMHFSGETKVAGNKEMPEGMTIPISIESVITVEPML